MVSHTELKSIEVEELDNILRLHFDFDEKIIDSVRSLPTRKYNPELKVWEIPNNNTAKKQLQEKLQPRFRLVFKEKNIHTDTKVPENFSKHLLRKRYSQSTIRNYTHHLSLFLQFCSPETEITDNHILDYVDHIIKNLKASPSYQNMALNAIRFYKVTVLEEQMPRLNIRPKREKKLPTVLSEEEVTAILKSVSNEKHRCILSLIYSAGLRISEAINLRLNEIDRNRGVLIIRQSKGKKDRNVPLSNKISFLIDNYIAHYSPKKFLFEGQTGGAILYEKHTEHIF